MKPRTLKILLVVCVALIITTLFVQSPRGAAKEKPKPYIIEVVVPGQVMVRANDAVYRCLDTNTLKTGLQELAKTYLVLATGASIGKIGTDNCTDSVLVTVEPLAGR